MASKPLFTKAGRQGGSSTDRGRQLYGPRSAPLERSLDPSATATTTRMTARPLDRIVVSEVVCVAGLIFVPRCGDAGSDAFPPSTSRDRRLALGDKFPRQVSTTPGGMDEQAKHKTERCLFFLFAKSVARFAALGCAWSCFRSAMERTHDYNSC